MSVRDEVKEKCCCDTCAHYPCDVCKDDPDDIDLTRSVCACWDLHPDFLDNPKIGLRCENCAWYAYDGVVGECDSAYVTDIMFHDAYYNADECGLYRKRDEFEDYLIAIIRNFEKKEIDEFKAGDPLNIKRYHEVKEVVEKILWRYQEMLCEVER